MVNPFITRKEEYVQMFEDMMALQKQRDALKERMEKHKDLCTHTWETGKEATFPVGAYNICFLCQRKVSLTPDGIINTIGL